MSGSVAKCSPTDPEIDTSPTFASTGVGTGEWAMQDSRCNPAWLVYMHESHEFNAMRGFDQKK